MPEDWEIVGVVEDAKYQDTHGPAYATYFLPYFQSAVEKQPRRGAGEGGLEPHADDRAARCGRSCPILKARCETSWLKWILTRPLLV